MKYFKRIYLLCFRLFFCLVIALPASAKTWYPVTAGSITGLRPGTADEILVNESDDGITYSLRNRGKTRTTTTFLLLDLGEIKRVDKIQFQNQVYREATTNIGYIKVYVAENEDNGEFDIYLKDNYTKELYKGAIFPILNSQGLLRTISIPLVEKRYFLIEVFATNRYIGDVGSPNYQVDTVQFSDILVLGD